jgi:hypothetical protein
VKIVFFISIILILIIFATFEPDIVRAHDAARPELDHWFMGLQSKGKSPCCDGTDALRVDDVDWESKDGHYRVRLEGQWVDVPESAVIEGPNRAGPAMVWPYRKDGKLNQIRCFLAGASG